MTFAELDREQTTRTLPAVKRKSARLPFLDWTRGLAAIIMLQGHVLHSWAEPSVRTGGVYVLSQFVGGMTPAIFLFLTGVTLAFMLDGLDKKGASAREKILTALRRAGYLAVLAFAFRFQLWLFAYPQSPASDLLKVDILNCMALGIASVAVLALFGTRARIKAGFLAGAIIAGVSPLIADLPAGSLPWILSIYLKPDVNYFSYFPWAAFVAFGISAGSVLRIVTAEQLNKVMQWAAIAGFGLVLSGQYFSNLPYSIYSSADFWLDSPALIFIKLGLILLLLAAAYLWTYYGSAGSWSWVRQLGTNSLLVYWVHIELVYGRWLGFFKETLTIGQCVAASILLILAMVGLSYVRSNWQFPKLRLGSVTPAEPQRASGD